MQSGNEKTPLASRTRAQDPEGETMNLAKTLQDYAPFALGAAAGFAVIVAIDPADNLEEIRLVSEFNGAKDGVARRDKTLSTLQAAAAITGILAALSAGARCGGKWTRALLPFAVGALAGYVYTKDND